MTKEAYDAWMLFGVASMPFVTIAGFAFLYRQLKADRETLETQTSWQIYTVSSSILQTFMQYPECRPFFYDRRPLPPDEPLRSRVLTAVELVCDHMENLYLHRNALDSKTYDVWVPYVRRLYENSPAMQDFLRKEAEGYRYSGEFLTLLERRT